MNLSAQYTDFADEVLLAVYKDSASNPQSPCVLRDVLLASNLSHLDSWVPNVCDDFKRRGLWTVEIGSGPMVYMTALGLEKAEQIRRDRASRTIIGRLRSIPRSDWISLFALIVAVAALIKQK